MGVILHNGLTVKEHLRANRQKSKVTAYHVLSTDRKNVEAKLERLEYFLIFKPSAVDNVDSAIVENEDIIILMSPTKSFSKKKECKVHVFVGTTLVCMTFCN